MKEGNTVKGVPPRRAWNRMTDIKWEDHAQTAKATGEAVLAATHIPESRAKSVRKYTNPPFVQDDGRIKVSIRNSIVEDDGVRYGDVYLTWQKATKKKEK
jgi:hypothetical protein